MLQARIMTRLLIAALDGRTPRILVELGAGDGTFMLALARRLAPRWRDVKVTLVDRQDIVTEHTRRAFDDLGWQVETISAEIFDFLRGATPGCADVVVANLFLHHFERDSLQAPWRHRTLGRCLRSLRTLARRIRADREPPPLGHRLQRRHTA